MIDNCRKHAASRSKAKNGFSRAIILQGKKQHDVQLLDYDSGGIGINISDNLNKRLQLVLAKVVKIQFFLGGVRHEDTFIVRSIRGERVGLMYANEKYMSPQQRLIAGQNIGRL